MGPLRGAQNIQRWDCVLAAEERPPPKRLGGLTCWPALVVCRRGGDGLARPLRSTSPPKYDRFQFRAPAVGPIDCVLTLPGHYTMSAAAPASAAPNDPIAQMQGKASEYIQAVCQGHRKKRLYTPREVTEAQAECAARECRCCELFFNPSIPLCCDFVWSTYPPPPV